MLTWESFNLTDDPFSVAPRKDKIVWADREDFIRQLKNAFRRSLLSTPSRIIACIWGDWGAGKTHAMTHFSRPDVIKKLIEEMKLQISLLPISIPLTFPLNNILDTIYLDLTEQIGVKRIIQALNTFEPKTIRSRGVFVREISKYMDPRVAEAFATLKGVEPLFFQRYLSMTATSTELRNLGIPRGVSTANDKVRTISGILNLLTGTVASRVFIWFDDLERIGDIPGREVFAFQYFIRDLLDSVPENLVIIFNMTLMPGEEVEDRLAYLGDAITYRISDRILVQPLTKKEFLSYVRDLLQIFRSQPSKKEIEFFPFEKPALEFVFSQLEQRKIHLQPRNVNQILSLILSEAINDEEKTDPTITKEYIATHLTEVFARVSLPKT